MVDLCLVRYFVVDVERKRGEETGTVHDFYPRPDLQTVRGNPRGIAVRFRRVNVSNICV